MNYSLDMDKYCLAELSGINLYVTSYEVTRDRRYNFQNKSQSGLYFTDNGSYPAYLKLKGFILKSECSSPCVVFNEHMDSNMHYFLTLDGIYFNAARLKTFSVITEKNSPVIKCEVLLCCDSYMSDGDEEETV